MKVKRTAWHYRYYCFLKEGWKEPFALWDIIRGKRRVKQYQPRSLCSYFWFCVVSTLTLPIVTLLVGLTIAIILGILSPLVWGADKVEEIAKERRSKKGLAPKQTGVVRSFLKAKKQKVCPMIEVVD